MTETPNLSQIEESLGTEFWSQPESALRDPFNLIYASALAALREEVRERSGGITDYLLVERLAFSYAILRQRESDTAAQLTDRTRRELNKDWLEFTLALKKNWLTEDKVDQSDVLLKKINKAVLEAVKDMPAEHSAAIQRSLADAFEAAGI